MQTINSKAGIKPAFNLKTFIFILSNIVQSPTLETSVSIREGNIWYIYWAKEEVHKGNHVFCLREKKSMIEGKMKRFVNKGR